MDTMNNNLSLTVINDGEGTQCGFSYKGRCAILSSGTEESRARAALQMVTWSNRWMIKRGHDGEGAAGMLVQAAKVLEYYADHFDDESEAADA